MARPLDGVALDAGVVLLVDPAAAREIRAAEESDEDGGRIHATLRKPVLGLERDAGRGRLPALCRRRGEAVVDDRLARESLCRNAGDLPGAGHSAAHPPSMPPSTMAMSPSVVTRPTSAIGMPQRSQTLANVGELVRRAGREHPLLRLGDHDLPRRHTGFAPRNRVEVQQDAGAGLVGRLGAGAADARGAEVLDADDESTA